MFAMTFGDKVRGFNRGCERGEQIDGAGVWRKSLEPQDRSISIPVVGTINFDFIPIPLLYPTTLEL
jgi:hypothetical protein